MERIVADARFAEVLAIRTSPVEVVDPSGRVVGVFTPSIAPSDDYGIEPSDLTPEELDALANSDGPWHTTDEVLVHLRKLG